MVDGPVQVSPGSGAISSITTVWRVQSPVLTGQRAGGRSLLVPSRDQLALMALGRAPSQSTAAFAVPGVGAPRIHRHLWWH